MRSKQCHSFAFRINLARKLLHGLGLCIPLALEFKVCSFLSPYFSYPTRIALILLLGSNLALLLIIDTLRLRIRKVNRIFMQILGPLLKYQEGNRYNGSIPYLLACLLLLLTAASPVIVLASFFLMLGDPAAAYFGNLHGRIRLYNHKSLEGMLAFLLIAFGSGLLYLIYREFNASTALLFPRLNLANMALVFGAALCASAAELFSETSKSGIIDDNLLIPLASAAGLCIGGLLFTSWPADAFLSPFALSMAAKFN